MNTNDQDNRDAATRLHQGMLRLTRRLRAGRDKTALSPTKLLVLSVLRERGPLAAARLAAGLGIQPQSLTRLLAELEGRDAIVRRTDPADRRQSLLEPTPTGIGLLEADLEGRRQRLARAMDATLTPAERDILAVAAGLMDRLAAAMEPGHPGRADSGHDAP